MPKILPYRQEVYRKIIHISSSGIAFLLWYFGKDVMLPFIVTIAIIFPIVDYSKKYIPFIKKIYFSLFVFVTRLYEHRELSGASWVFMGAGFTTCIFNEEVAVIALLVMSLSDSVAAIIGIKYGSTKLFNKSLEGSLAFFITTYLIICIFTPATIIMGIIVAGVTTIIELFSYYKLNDNILIPIATALILTLGGIS